MFGVGPSIEPYVAPYSDALFVQCAGSNATLGRWPECSVQAQGGVGRANVYQAEETGCQIVGRSEGIFAFDRTGNRAPWKEGRCNKRERNGAPRPHVLRTSLVMARSVHGRPARAAHRLTGTCLTAFAQAPPLERGASCRRSTIPEFGAYSISTLFPTNGAGFIRCRSKIERSANSSVSPEVP
jgi:hypothetical protein